MCKRVLSMPRSDVHLCSMQQQICASCGALLKARLLMMPAVHIHAEGAALYTDDGRRIVGLVDFEESAAGDPAYDLRYLPALAPTLDLLRAVMDSYATTTGQPLEKRRVLAWHVLTDLGDALWRTEQGADVVDGPIARRFDDLLVRLDAADW